MKKTSTKINLHQSQPASFPRETRSSTSDRAPGNMNDDYVVVQYTALTSDSTNLNKNENYNYYNL